MSQAPILLFLHGVGSGDPGDHWERALEATLRASGYPGLDGVSVIAPKYPTTLLHGSDDSPSMPRLNTCAPSAAAARENYGAFMRRSSALEARLGRHDPGAGIVGGHEMAGAAIDSPFMFARATNYLRDGRIRALVLNRILDRLPDQGTVVIVGHSLGSVIAADLVRRVPEGLDIIGMVTIGSPLANSDFHVSGLLSALRQPPTNLAWWVNLWNPFDPVTTGRGVSSAFPYVLDLRLPARLGLDVHDASTYLSSPVVAEAIGYALFGSLSTELAVAERGPDIPLDAEETMALLSLRYAFLTADRLEHETSARYSAALRQVQGEACQRLRQRRADLNRPVPRLVVDLAVDLGDPESVAPEPGRVHHLSPHGAVIALVTLAHANVIEPFEISVSLPTQQSALEDLALELGLGRQFGTDVASATNEARRVLAGEGKSWLKWTALGVGGAALLATGGLALVAAPAGLAGAAAITSALAAFGPGGMVGGLITAGTLVGVTSSGFAVGLAAPTTAAETVAAFVSAQVAAAIVRSRQHMDQDPGTWLNLVETRIELARERAHLAACCDENAPVLRDLDHKLTTVDRALTYLTELGLGTTAQGGTTGSNAWEDAFNRTADAFRWVDIDGDGVPDKPRAATAVEGVGSAIRGAAVGAAGSVGGLFRRGRPTDPAEDPPRAE